MDDIGLYKDNLRGYDESGWDLAYNASWQNVSCEITAVLVLFIKKINYMLFLLGDLIM